ncbi:MAG: HEAT repeat domain-containing protein [Flavobacteriaceae bacterium]
MNDKHVTEKLADYLDGLLDEAEHEKVSEHLAQCSDCKSEWEQMRQLLKAFKAEEESIPSSRLETNFDKMLKEVQGEETKVISMNKKGSFATAFLKIAAGIALLVGAFTLGKFQQQEQSNKAIAAIENKSLAIKETAMLSLMENQSASRRIQGVNFIEEFEEPDEAIIKALANRMLYDENKNVRLSAVEALGKFTNSEAVKNAFIIALETEKDPSIQITIIHTLVAIQEKKAIAPMQRLLEQEETQPFIKQQIKSLLPNII